MNITALHLEELSAYFCNVMFYAFRWFNGWTFATFFRKTEGHRIAESFWTKMYCWFVFIVSHVQYVSYILLPPCFVEGKSHSDFQEDSRVWVVRGKAAFSKWAGETAAARCSQCRDSTTHTHVYVKCSQYTHTHTDKQAQRTHVHNTYGLVDTRCI